MDPTPVLFTAPPVIPWLEGTLQSDRDGLRYDLPSHHETSLHRETPITVITCLLTPLNRVETPLFTLRPLVSLATGRGTSVRTLTSWVDSNPRWGREGRTLKLVSLLSSGGSAPEVTLAYTTQSETRGWSVTGPTPVRRTFTRLSMSLPSSMKNEKCKK